MAELAVLLAGRLGDQLGSSPVLFVQVRKGDHSTEEAL